MSENPFNYLENKKYISLKTFYKSGKGVATPVEFAEKNGKLYVNTRKNSWKVKRIRGNSRAKIAPCTIRGKLLGEEIDVTVRILSDDEEVNIAKQALNEKLNKGINKVFILFSKFFSKIQFWKEPEERTFLEISP
ncbi:MAG: PPOX class F420-dependent oxidoreductase [Candidatus Hodarchaeota archaeon]